MFFLASKIIAVFLLTQLPSLHSGAHSFLPDQNLTSESDQSSVDCCKMPSLQLLNCWTCLIIKRWKYNPHERRFSSGWSVCARVCVCACAARSKTDKQNTLWASGASKRSNAHKACKTDGFEEYSLKNTVYIFKWTRTVGRKIVCQYLSQWQIGASSMLIKEQNTKTKSLTALNLNKVIA